MLNVNFWRLNACFFKNFLIFKPHLHILKFHGILND